MKSIKRIIFIILVSVILISCNKPDDKVYKISYDLNGGICDSLINEFEYDEIVTLPIPSKEGFNFLGWYEENTGDVVSSISNKDYLLVAKWEKIEVFELIIKEYPNNNTFYNDEIISFDGLVISLKSNKNEYIIKDFQLDYDVILGEVKVFVYYEDYETFFYINIIERKKESLINHFDYSDKTTHSIIYDDYINIVEDISYSSTRGANMIIMFNQNNIVKTNIYGYEILVDEYGKIIEKDINVELTSKGMVISAHGTRVKDIKNLNIGDYVLLLNNYLYVYDGSCVSNANDVFLKFEELTNNVKLVKEVKVYNEVIAKLNDVIPLLNNLYNSYDSDLHQSVKLDWKILIFLLMI